MWATASSTRRWSRSSSSSARSRTGRYTGPSADRPDSSAGSAGRGWCSERRPGPSPPPSSTTQRPRHARPDQLGVPSCASSHPYTRLTRTTMMFFRSSQGGPAPKDRTPNPADQKRRYRPIPRNVAICRLNWVYPTIHVSVDVGRCHRVPVLSGAARAAEGLITGLVRPRRALEPPEKFANEARRMVLTRAGASIRRRGPPGSLHANSSKPSGELLNRAHLPKHQPHE